MNDKKQTLELRKTVRQRVPEANIMVAQTELIIATISLVIRVIIEFTSLSTSTVFANTTFIYLPIIMLAVSAYCLIEGGKAAWLKYILLFLLCFYLLMVDIVTGFKTKATLLLPILVTMRYYDKKLSFSIYLTLAFMLLLIVLANTYFNQLIEFIDLNVVSFKEGISLSINGFLIDEVIAANPPTKELLKNGLILTYIPNFLVLTIGYITSNAVMENTRNIIFQLNEETLKEKEKEAELIDARTKVILSQVKPHFIYNTLTSIAYLCGKDPQKAKDLTLNFSGYLRGNLDPIADESLTLVDFNTELEHLKNYLNIELVRFENKLKVVYDIKCSDFKLPSLTIQPIVENAVKHGICKKENGGTVKISSRKTSEGYEIKIKDDGVGFDVQKVQNDEKVHVGLDNTRQRLALCKGTLEIKSRKDKGTTIIVKIPFEENYDHLCD